MEHLYSSKVRWFDKYDYCCVNALLSPKVEADCLKVLGKEAGKAERRREGDAGELHGGGSATRADGRDASCRRIWRRDISPLLSVALRRSYPRPWRPVGGANLAPLWMMRSAQLPGTIGLLLLLALAWAVGAVFTPQREHSGVLALSVAEYVAVASSVALLAHMSVS